MTAQASDEDRETEISYAADTRMLARKAVADLAYVPPEAKDDRIYELLCKFAGRGYDFAVGIGKAPPAADRGLVDKLNLARLDVVSLKSDLAAAERERDRLRDALESFAAHRDGCRYHRDGPETCDCGLDAALTAAPEPKEPM